MAVQGGTSGYLGAAVAVVVIAVSAWRLWPGRAEPVHKAERSATAVVLRQSLLERGAPIALEVAPSIPDIRVGVNHEWYVAVRPSDGTAAGSCRIRLDATMPAHGHGLPTLPRVESAPDGARFKVEGVRFSMPGQWQLRVIAECGDSKQVSTFDLQIS